MLVNIVWVLLISVFWILDILGCDFIVLLVDYILSMYCLVE